MIQNDLIIFDWETSSIDPNTCQPLSLGAVHVNPRRLVIGEKFYELIKPSDEDTIDKRALEVNKLDLAELRKARTLDAVWKDFVAFVNKYNYKKTSFFAPIACGYNIRTYDMVIVDRIAKAYGPYDQKRGCQNLFNNFSQIDLIDDVKRWMGNSKELPNFKLDTVREYFGMSSENAHNALQDCLDCGEILIKFQKLYRTMAPKIKFKDCCLKCEPSN